MPAQSEPADILSLICDHFIAVFTFDLGRYLVAAGLITGFLLIARSWADARRIQARRASRSDVAREFLSSLRTVFVFGVTTLSTLALEQAGIIRFAESEIGWPIFLAQFTLIVVAHDAYFYWMHRALHHRRLFRATHLHHHRSRTPTPWAAYSFSVWEGMTEAAFMPIFLLCASLLGLEYAGFAIFLFLAHMILRNAMGHAGVELFPAGWVHRPWLDWMSTTTHHDLHHSEGRHNFGLYFTWWDRWMGTEHPDYKTRFDAVARPWLVRRSVAPPADQPSH